MPESTRLEHAAHNRTLGIPFVEDTPLHDRPLAIVGGGPSILGRVDELQNWPGDVWAINGAFRFCKSWGIKAVYVTLDPLPIVGDMELEAGDEAILADCADPSVFDKLGHAKLKIYRIDASNCFGPTSATMSLLMAPMLGYQKIHFFGCESSFRVRETSHAFATSPDYPGELVIECGGLKYMAPPTLYMQAQLLSEMIRKAPDVYFDKSGGLMGSMAKHGDHSVIAGDRQIAAKVIKPEYHGGLCPFEFPLEERA